MNRRIAIPFVLSIILSIAQRPAQAQMQIVASTDANDVTIDYYRPQIAAAPDGSFAVAWEALRQGDFFTKWHIAVQRYSPAGAPVGPTHYFQPEIGCFVFDTWLDDFQSNVELEFSSTGVLLVLMQHSGDYEAITQAQFSSEITLGVVDQNGATVDLNLEKQNCIQWKFIYPGADEQDRPRMALMPDNTLVLTMDGFFNGSDLRNVGLDFYDNNLNRLVPSELIPHDDPASLQAFHMWPDIATNGDLLVSVWNECPIVDPQGNADECDIGAQFARITPTAIQPIGSNVVVNTGDPTGTINWRPSVDMTPAGTSVVVWQDFRTGSQGDVFGQLFDASGQPVGSNFQISEGAGIVETRPEIRPEVALLDDGQFMVVWADTSAAGYQARGRRYAANGTPLTTPFLLDETSGLETGVPNIASNGSAYYLVTLGRSPNGDLSVLATAPTSNTANQPSDAVDAGLELSAYPNPFSENATIEFDLAKPTTIHLSVYDLLGREVETVAAGIRGSGSHAVTVDGTALAPGLYVIRLRYDERQETHLLVRGK